MKRVYKFISTLGYIGYVPYAPGTAGSLLACLLIFILPEVSTAYYMLGLTVLFVLGLFSSHQYSRLNGIKDPQEVVIDEAIGVAIGLLMIPKVLIYYILAFYNQVYHNEIS